MKTLEIFDPAMCCSTGVCGPAVDPQLVQFAADLQWLQEQGVTVRRHNLSQEPAAFVANAAVKDALTAKGEAALPMILADGAPVASGTYPARADLAAAAGLPGAAPSLLTPAVTELVAIAAAVAANCEPCLRFHVNLAQKHGASLADIAAAVELAAKVKDAPHRAILRLAAKLTQPPAAEAPAACCGGDEPAAAASSGGRCCG